ncbi:DUF2063 domain-containing protein [Mesorhizobium sp. NBSH29]|uniref:HvfC/BufC N-terminal domain-containing protein n=1 Tax=Mesorhizobium sp. NBSH29 TaxID=2654249 RepID=UPI001896704F|nr:DNA-binding domain-containing protein [Mesorhizobium sp. NBSH29]QPC87320.1 DUF2063 domain-containing protein [Mesorhizobium sp. NBSH29]
MQLPDAAHEFSTSFATPLLDPKRAPPVEVMGPNGKGAVKRYAVYRNNVTVSLIEALTASFPAVQRITGDHFFRAMARFHIRETPPVSPLLFEYGSDFPGFIRRYEHAQSIPWLSDVASVERAWLDAYHAADQKPLAPEALAGVAPENLADVRLKPHPATRVVRAGFPAISIFAANRSSGPVGPIDVQGPEDGLITRPGLEVVVRHLPLGGAVFFTCLMAGMTLGDAVEAATAENATFDIAANIAGMIEAGAFATIHSGD